MVQQKSLTATLRASRPTVPAGADTAAFPALVSLKALVPEPEEGKRRKPMDLVVVLDKSGSMGSDGKLELCKKTLAFLVDTALQPEDRLSLYTFDSDVSCEFKLTPMNADNKASVLGKVQRLQPGSNTNLSAGLFAGLAELQASPETSVTSILLLSDGQLNEGITDRAKLVRTLKSTLETSRVRPPVFTFGYGSDADANIMRDLAEAAGGNYYAVISTESVPLAFSDVVGGLLAVVAQNVDVTVTVTGATIVDMYGCRFPTDVTSPTSRVVHIKDMYAGESRDLLVKLSVPAGRDAVTIAATVSYLDVVLEKPVVLDPAPLVVERIPGDKPDDSTLEDSEVARHVARAEASVALEEARAAADAGNYTAGLQALRAKKAVIATNLSKAGVVAEDDEMVAEVMQDMDIGEKAVRDSVTWRVEGRHRVAAAALSHSNQRSAKADDMVAQDHGLLQGFAPKPSTYAAAVPSKMSMMANAFSAFNMRGGGGGASSGPSSSST